MTNPWVAERPAGGRPPTEAIFITPSLNVYQIRSVKQKKVETEVRLFDDLLRNVVRKGEEFFGTFFNKEQKQMNLYLETLFKEQFERAFSSADHESLCENW